MVSEGGLDVILTAMANFPHQAYRTSGRTTEQIRSIPKQRRQWRF
jgi:hypothetical protein